MKSLGDESGSESGSDSDSDSDSDSKSGPDSDSESSEEEKSSGSLPVYDPKLSHSSWQFDKKTKYFKCNNSSWYSAISKKTHDKFTVELGTGVGSYMVGMIPKSSYNQNAANYNSGYFWYSSSSSLYGQGTKLSFSVYGGSTAGMKIGASFNRKKINNYIF
jgi:hypothetical protein